MTNLSLDVQDRPGLGKGNVNRLRREGMLPGVAYGIGDGAIPVVVNTHQFVTLARKATSSQLFNLNSSNGSLNGKLALVKEIQKDYVKSVPLHVDLQVLREDKPITVSIPLHVEGESPGVKNEGGVLTVAARELKIDCLPRQIPQYIVVDISALNLGESIHARDLKLPNGVELHGKPDETIASVVVSKTAAVAEAAAAATPAAAAEGAATAEGAAAAPAEGAAGAEGAAKAEGGDKAAAEKGKGDKK